ncbi:MAG: hypothetical protein M1814_006657 [Vezdaea aestivalis]|nr:MAG: hypothetical protein M1814_006657 [Vezdaea aestivalis]
MSEFSAANEKDELEIKERKFSIAQVDGSSKPVIADSDIGGEAVNPLLVLCCITIGASSFFYGYDNNLISPIVALKPFVEKYQGVNPVTKKYVFTAYNQNLLFSVPLVASIIGALVTPPLTFRLGRKWPLLASYFFSFGGVFLQLFAKNMGTFVAGRFLNNFVMGITMATAPLYIAEVVPISMRGGAVASLNIMNLIAGVVATIVVYGTHKIDGKLSYMVPLAVQCATPAILIPITLFLPESPQWLAGKNRMEEARVNLRKLRGFTDAMVKDELRVMKMCEDNERKLKESTQFWNIFNRENIKRTITAGSFFSLNQISGIILSTTYATVFLVELGVANPFGLTVIASCCVLAGTIVAPLLLDRTGRRPTALSGMIVLFVIDLIAGGLAFNSSKRSFAIGIAALSFIFNFFWAASFYSLSSLLPSEIATPRLRNYTVSYTIGWAQTTAVITTLAVPQLVAQDAANLGAKTYLVFAGCMFLIIIFVYCLLPETKGRSFAEIDEMYDAGVPMKQWRDYKTSTKAKKATVVSDEAFSTAQKQAGEV